MPDSILRHGDPIPRRNVLRRIYIDDHVVFGLVDREKARETAGFPDVELMVEAKETYADIGWPTTESKSYSTTTHFTTGGGRGRWAVRLRRSGEKS
jgi:hypothetical protein